MKEIALKAAALPKENKSRPRLVVFTQGADPAIAVIDGHAHEFPAVRLAKDLVVDTNGAGDSFVGGFLSRCTCRADPSTRYDADSIPCVTTLCIAPDPVAQTLRVASSPSASPLATGAPRR